MGMKQSANGRKLTQEREGLRLEAYKDGGGVWTIGYGHTQGVKSGQTCTAEQAEAWYLSDVQSAEHDVELYVTVPLNQGQFDALVDWTFNLGGERLRKSTMLRRINDKDFDAALKEMLRWKYDNGVEVAGLLARRQEEVKLWKGEL